MCYIFQLISNDIGQGNMACIYFFSNEEFLSVVVSSFQKYYQDSVKHVMIENWSVFHKNYVIK